MQHYLIIEHTSNQGGYTCVADRFSAENDTEARMEMLAFAERAAESKSDYSNSGYINGWYDHRDLSSDWIRLDRDGVAEDLAGALAADERDYDDLLAAIKAGHAAKIVGGYKMVWLPESGHAAYEGGAYPEWIDGNFKTFAEAQDAVQRAVMPDGYDEPGLYYEGKLVCALEDEAAGITGYSHDGYYWTLHVWRKATVEDTHSHYCLARVNEKGEADGDDIPEGHFNNFSKREAVPGLYAIDSEVAWGELHADPLDVMDWPGHSEDYAMPAYAMFVLDTVK